ncbi:hypothetical protein [Moumouvirus maliensis]|nr:hypothetical protein [Moumouvirus maliensis]
MDDLIIKAVIYKRPGNGFYGDIGGDHYGTKVTTNSGKNFLIHSTPEHGTIITNTDISNKWKIVEIISINNNKTPKELFKIVSGKTNNKIINYLTSGTCIGVSYHVKYILER